MWDSLPPLEPALSQCAPPPLEPSYLHTVPPLEPAYLLPPLEPAFSLPPLEPVSPPLEPEVFSDPPPLEPVTENNEKCLIINFADGTCDDELMSLFKDADPVIVSITRDRPAHHPTTAVLYLSTREGLAAALTLDGIVCNRKKIRVIDISDTNDSDLQMRVSVLLNGSEHVRRVILSENSDERKVAINDAPMNDNIKAERLVRIQGSNYINNYNNNNNRRQNYRKVRSERMVQIRGAPYPDVRQRGEMKREKFLHPPAAEQKPQASMNTATSKQKPPTLMSLPTRKQKPQPVMCLPTSDVGRKMTGLVNTATRYCCPECQPWSPADLDNSIFTVCITVVVDATHVWGHIIDDNTRPDLMWLTGITACMQYEDCRRPYTEGSRSCCAKYQGEWCRGCVLSQEGQKMEVFALDYGNTMVVEDSDIGDLPQNMWSKPAQVWPLRVLSSAAGALTSLINVKVVCKKLNRDVEDEIMCIKILRRGDLVAEEDIRCDKRVRFSL